MAVEIMNCQGYKEDGKTVRFVPVGFVDSVTGKLTIEEGEIPSARQDQYSAQSLIRRNRSCRTAARNTAGGCSGKYAPPKRFPLL